MQLAGNDRAVVDVAGRCSCRLHLGDSVLLWCTSVRDWVLRSYTDEGFLNARALQGFGAVVSSFLGKGMDGRGRQGEVRVSLANQGA